MPHFRSTVVDEFSYTENISELVSNLSSLFDSRENGSAKANIFETSKTEL